MRPLPYILLLACLTLDLPVAAGEDIDFSRDIRPVLSENCFHCHGPDEKKREADLRLDTREGALTVLTPGKSAESEIVRRLTSTDPDEQMPPPKSNRKLTPQQIADVKRWIDGGAAWGDHWAFRKLAAPPVPDVPSSAAHPLRNPIDAFVQARLAKEKLTPAAEAPRDRLIRRVSLDLTGLPPSPAAVDAFLADHEPGAYERVVERLLASPAFGERMAWDWLDAARYADSNGYQGDTERTMWPWRDWVVGAFNRNLPYDQFTVWQLAGDALPGATVEQRLATGFCRNHMINGEGGRIAEENRVDYVMDMAETMATVWLGLTTNCCRCHDHKFDPLTQRDYYGLFAFFNQTPVTGGGGNPQTPPVLEFPSEQETKDIAQLEEKIADVKRQLEARAAELEAGEGSWEERLAATATTDWHALKTESARSLHQTLTVQEDGSILASGENPVNDRYNVLASVDLETVRALRLEAIRDPSLTGGGLARSDSGNFVLTEFEVFLNRPGKDGANKDGTEKPRQQPVKIASALATFEQNGFPITNAFDAKTTTGWAVWEGRSVDRDHQAVFVLAEPVKLEPGSTLTITLRHDSPHRHHNLGRFRLSATSQADARPSQPPRAIVAALGKEPKARSKEERALASQGYRQVDEGYRKLLDEQTQSETRLGAIRKGIVKVMVMEDQPQPRKTFRLERGLYNKPGDEVTAAVPASLPPLPAAVVSGESAAQPNRLSLAQWLVSPEQPLTPRVTVNRFWQQFFGIGLVKTTEDFGVQGEMPKHLELLDWLAADFRDSGWDTKRLVRQIVTSHAYRQSSKVSAELLEKDPDNRLLARGPRMRMPSWMLRDQALASSGLLAARLGGPPVNGYQPAGVWEEATFGNKKYKQDHGDSLYRRSLYTFWRRIVGPTMFFDNAARQVCTVKVFRTNTPLHALLTLNDTTYVEAARALAQAVLTTTADAHALVGNGSAPDGLPVTDRGLTQGIDGNGAQLDAARLDEVLRRVLARRATPEERAILLGGLQRSRDEFRAQPDEARKLLAVGEAKRDERLDAVEHAAWTSLCLAILNLDEALTKE